MIDDQVSLSGAPLAAHIFRAEKPAFSRTEVAKTKRAFQDLDANIEKARNVIANVLANAKTMGLEEFKQAWEAREELTRMFAQVDSLQNGFAKHMPKPTEFLGVLSPQERAQIIALYASGLYTQQQLAAQYGVSQATIARIVAT